MTAENRPIGNKSTGAPEVAALPTAVKVIPPSPIKPQRAGMDAATASDY